MQMRHLLLLRRCRKPGWADMAADPKQKPIAENRRARFDYFLEEFFEAGLMLTGTEVKSLRVGKANIAESYAAVNGLRVAHLSLTRRSTEAVNALRSTLAVTRVSAHLWKVGMDTTRDVELLLTYAPPSAADLQQLQTAFTTMDIDDDVREALIRERARLITMAWPGAASPPTASCW